MSQPIFVDTQKTLPAMIFSFRILSYIWPPQIIMSRLLRYPPLVDRTDDEEQIAHTCGMMSTLSTAAFIISGYNHMWLWLPVIVIVYGRRWWWLLLYMCMVVHGHCHLLSVLYVAISVRVHHFT